jgi:hypothetical protein
MQTINAMISQTVALLGKRFGSLPTTQPRIVAQNTSAAQGIELAIPHAIWCGFIKEIHDHSRTPTKGRATAIGSRPVVKRIRMKLRIGRGR